jgi:hypothetical protein
MGVRLLVPVSVARASGGRVRESTMKPVRKPDARDGHVRFDERVVSRTRREARCCMKDEGRPFGAALWEEAPNCRKLLWPKAAVVNVPVKRRDLNHVMYGLERRMQMNL